jgi:hypothetical protein
MLHDATDLIHVCYITATCCLHNILREEYVNTNISEADNHAMSIYTYVTPLARSGDCRNLQDFAVREKFRYCFDAPHGTKTINYI